LIIDVLFSEFIEHCAQHPTQHVVLILKKHTSKKNLTLLGHRVQIIKKDKEKGGGKLEFGTKIIHNKQGTIATLLGASPRASTAVSAMIEVIQKCFPEYTDWQKNIQKCIPSYGIDLSKNADEYLKVLQYTNGVLL